MTSEVTDDIESVLTTEDKDAGKRIKCNRRPSLNYKVMGIDVVATLSYVNDSSIQVTVISDRKVSYKDREMFLTAVTKGILRLPYDIQPTKYWEYEKRNLRDIYDDTYPIDE